MDMAPPIVPEPRPATTSRPQHNLHNPLPLSSSQEAEVRKLYYARVRSKCADEVKRELSISFPGTPVKPIILTLCLCVQNLPTVHEVEHSA